MHTDWRLEITYPRHLHPYKSDWITFPDKTVFASLLKGTTIKAKNLFSYPDIFFPLTVAPYEKGFIYQRSKFFSFFCWNGLPLRRKKKPSSVWFIVIRKAKKKKKRKRERKKDEKTWCEMLLKLCVCVCVCVCVCMCAGVFPSLEAYINLTANVPLTCIV